MGRLGGFKYKEVVKRLRSFGFEEYRHKGGSHQVWLNPVTRARAVVPKHRGDLPEGTLRSILKQAEIKPNDFLDCE